MKVILKRIKTNDRRCNGCIFYDGNNCSLIDDRDKYENISCYDEDSDTDYIFVVDRVVDNDNYFVVYNINGDVIGVADSYDNALQIYDERYHDEPDDIEDKIKKFPLNKMIYS